MALLSFRRITSSGNFIPEIDGLRFVAIASVVFFHLSGFLIATDDTAYTDRIDYSWLTYIVSHGHLGVPLFFVISGMVLGLPFARHYLLGQKKVSLKNYFLRRLTRLEPPYIVAMTLLFIGCVYVAHTLSLQEALKSYASSLLYSHNIIYGKSVLPLINCVTWSLEVEVQFYILAPLLAMVFKISSAGRRRLIICLAILIFIMAGNYVQLPFISLFEYLEYFLLGFLLADLFLSYSSSSSRIRSAVLWGILSFAGIWAFDGNELDGAFHKSLWELYFICCLFVFCYLVLMAKTFPFLSRKAVTDIGGMCYSIYLLHYAVISLAGRFILRYAVSPISFLNKGLYAAFIILMILVCSGMFFLAVERPCMNKDWYRRFLPGRSKPAI